MPICLIVVLNLLSALDLDGDQRTLWMFNVHTREELRGRPFSQAGLPDPIRWAQWNHFFRSWRTKEQHTVSPRLLRVLAQIQSHFGKRRIELVSGFRRPRDGEAPHSYHQLGSAADIRIPEVATRDLHNFCLTFDRVGCGYYERGWVHVDVRSRNSIWSDDGPDSTVTTSQWR